MNQRKHLYVRLLTALLALVMIVSGVGTLAAFAAEPYIVQMNANANANYAVKKDEPIGYHFKTNGAFSAFEVQIPTYNTSKNGLTVSFFKWDTNMAKTVAGTPLHTEKLENCPDWGWHKFDLSKTAPAGDYFIYLHDPVINENLNNYNIGVYAANNNKKGMGCMYVKGVETKQDMAVKIHFLEKLDEPFVDLVTFQDVGPDNSAGSQDYWDAGDETKMIGQRVNVSATILGFCFGMPTWGNPNCSIELSAYRWNETYEKTVAAGPFAKATVENLKDNSSNWLMFDEEMPAGEYLFAVSKINGLRVAIYFYTTNASKGYSYLDGAEIRNDLAFKVRFAKKLAAGQDAFLDCEGDDDRSNGTVTLPEPWQPAEDSLLNTHKVQPSTWVFTDGLGRESVQYGDEGVGAVNSEKVLAMFYWNWHLRCNNTTTANNLQEILDKYPEAKNDWDHNIWSTAKGTNYWNEPIYGYYDTTDPWVLRRHAEMLANIGVDAVFTDNSNVIMTFRNGYMAMYEEWTKAQEDGVNAPKISNILPFWYTGDTNKHWYTNEQMEVLYADIYRRGQYENLWFWFDGKPMIVGVAAHLEEIDDPIYDEMLSFFTFRRGVPSYVDAANRQAQERVQDWGWLAAYPQATYYASRGDASKNKVEQMTVGVSQNYDYIKKATAASNAGYMIAGRSYTSTNPTRFEEVAKGTSTPWSADSSKYGYNFAEQWEYALEVDPKVVFVTGYNEWTVTRYQSWKGTENSFNDLFNDEFSRDIEPTKGALKDHYYYQLINYTRKFKGAEEMPKPSYKATIDLSAGQDQWAAVEPYYAAYIGNTMDRNSYGRVGNKKYVDFSGRNDIIGAQIARDDEFVYFNVECNEDITPYTDKLWMNLYIDVDQTNKGWETFDFVVNKTAASEKTSVLEKFTDGYTSEKVADVEYTVDGKFMTVKIAKSDLGITGDDFTINFAWTDNVHDADDLGAIAKDGWVYSEFSGDIMDFYLTGDVAPGARFKFSYISTAENATIPPVGGDDETTGDETTADTEADTTVADDTTAADVTTEGDTTAAEADAGCKSSVALSAIALLTAIGAAVVLKKKED